MKAKIPVSIDGIEFDALISENRTLEATVPEYSVETGFPISDTIIFNSESLEMTLYVTDTPVTWRSRHGSGPGRVEAICKQLEELYYKGEPVTVVTSDATYTDMAIESITISKSADVGYAREIPISFKKIRVTSALTAEIPESYGKAGKSSTPAGTANTKQVQVEQGKSESTGSKGSEKTESKASILYGAAGAFGLLS